ncbi:MAG: M20/M25/M40 family metallo-hydrolase [Spirochaetes bacterium]|nr:M20/M25/M40 family metallo-hydrolase [Spirochaetota bacterium]
MMSTELDNIIINYSNTMLNLLRKSIQIESKSGNEGNFVKFIESWASEQKIKSDLFEVEVADMYNFYPAVPKHLLLKGRPALVLTIQGNGKGKSIIFNAHSDTVSEGIIENWNSGPFSGDYVNGIIFGLGACDTKGPLIAALWAMSVLNKIVPTIDCGDIMLELIPGEEDSVGLGTLGSIKRGYKADAAIILEPTENIPRCASRGGLRFSITATGKAIHGTVKWNGKDAIGSIRKVLDSLDKLEKEWNDRNSDDLFEPYPIARPITVDKVYGGEWQGMICDICKCEGYFELLPEDDINMWSKKFASALLTMLPDEDLDIVFSETYFGHRTSPDSELCRCVESVLNNSNEMLQLVKWSGFNSGCESGVRASLQKTPTLVWGPGSVRHAHSANEQIAFKDVQLCAKLFIETALKWIQKP